MRNIGWLEQVLLKVHIIRIIACKLRVNRTDATNIILCTLRASQHKLRMTGYALLACIFFGRVLPNFIFYKMQVLFGMLIMLYCLVDN